MLVSQAHEGGLGRIDLKQMLVDAMPGMPAQVPCNWAECIPLAVAVVAAQVRTIAERIVEHRTLYLPRFACTTQSWFSSAIQRSRPRAWFQPIRGSRWRWRWRKPLLTGRRTEQAPCCMTPRDAFFCQRIVAVARTCKPCSSAAAECARACRHALTTSSSLRNVRR